AAGGGLLPAAQLELELGHFHTEQRAGQGAEMPPRPSEEGGRTHRLSALPVVEGSGELGQRLEQLALGTHAAAPAGLPRFMRSEEVASGEANPSRLDVSVERMHLG